MPANCPVADLLPKFTAAVDRFNAVDALMEKPRRGGLTTAQLRRRQDAAWRRLRHLEAQAMLAEATSNAGVALQLVLALPDLDTIKPWASHDCHAFGSWVRVRGVVRSALSQRAVPGMPLNVIEFYAGRKIAQSFSQ